MSPGSKVVRHGREQGAEERVGAFLERELDDVAIVLHDLQVPGSPARVDHVVVAPTGIWVVDSTVRGGLELEWTRAVPRRRWMRSNGTWT